MAEQFKIYRRPSHDIEDYQLISETNNPTDDFIEIPLSNPTKEETLDSSPSDEQEEGANNPTDDAVQETPESAAPVEPEEGTNDGHDRGDPSHPTADDEEEEEKKEEGTDDGWTNERGFRIFNDLKSDIWIRLKIKTSTWVMGVGAVALVGVTAGAGAVAVATYGTAAAAAEVSLSLTAAAAATAASTSTVATVAGLTAGGWTVVGAVSGTGAVALGVGAMADAKGMKEMIARGEKFKNDAESNRISPGDYFEYKGYWNRNVQVLADGIIYQQTLKCEYGNEYRIEQDEKVKITK